MGIVQPWLRFMKSDGSHNWANSGFWGSGWKVHIVLVYATKIWLRHPSPNCPNSQLHLFHPKIGIKSHVFFCSNHQSVRIHCANGRHPSVRLFLTSQDQMSKTLSQYASVRSRSDISSYFHRLNLILLITRLFIIFLFGSVGSYLFFLCLPVNKTAITKS